MDWKILVLRVSAVGFVVWLLAEAASGLGWAPSIPAWVVVPIVVAFLVSAPFAFAARVSATSALRPARVVFGKGGTFEFHPANEPQPSPALYATQGMHAEPPGSHVSRVLSFSVADGIPTKGLQRAVAKATRQATRALPGVGKVHAQAHERPAPGPTDRLVVRLQVEGAGADESWADAAETAFRSEIARRLD